MTLTTQAAHFIANGWVAPPGGASIAMLDPSNGQVFAYIARRNAGGGVELPFGGMKHSGYGREKGFEALLGFSCLKAVAIKRE